MRNYFWLMAVAIVLMGVTVYADSDFEGEVRFQGDCWIDDDLDFDKGQTHGGAVFGRSTLELRKECQFAAKQAFGEKGSSGVFDIKPIQADNMGVEAQCWIDDDPDFDFGQVDGGKLIGQSSFDLRKECALVARARYGEKGSSGLKDIRLSPLASGLLQAECWIDDDLDFDFGQKDAGLVIGESSLELRRECQWVAEQRYKNMGSSGLKNMQPSTLNTNGVQAECWVDDDLDFDYGQKSGGTVMGRSTFQLRRECQLIARNFYGDQGSSGLKDVKGIDLSGGLLQGQCWLDDDPDFDKGQKDGGLVVGPSTFSLRRECAWMAKMQYGDKGSSGVFDVKAVSATFSLLKAQCWLDDDLDFDFGQTPGGEVYGQSTFEMRQECQLIATQRYGANGSSGLKDLQFLN